ncbi:MAG: hypothetical protein KJ666_00850 [Bacteroidetes bacterium]|nr:hypothetical protein [Bacteroidota bacterium]
MTQTLKPNQRYLKFFVERIVTLLITMLRFAHYYLSEAPLRPTNSKVINFGASHSRGRYIHIIS